MLNRKFAIIYAGFVVLSLAANYPGRPNADTVVMLWQAHNVSELNSWNSPFCTFFYGLLGPIFGYPLGALIAQSLVLLAWPAQVLSALISTPGARSVTRVTCIVLWTLVCCCFIALAGELVKDMIFCSFLSLVFLVSGSAENDELLWRISKDRAVALAASIVAIAVIRPSNVVLVAVVGLALVVWSKRSKLPVSAVLAAAVLMLCLSLVGSASQNWLFGATPANSYLATVGHDVAGISSYEHRDYFAELSGGQPDLASISKCYTPKQGDPFTWGDCKPMEESLRPLGTSLIRKWLELIVTHPGGYLLHRARFAANVLIADNTGTKNIVSLPPWYLTAINTAHGLAWLGKPELADHLQLWNPTIAYAPFGRFAGLLVGDGWLQQPLVWCFVLLAGFAWSIYHKSAGNMLSVFLLAVVGLGNVVMIVWIAPSDDLRYLYPTWMCALGVLTVACRNIMHLRSPALAEDV